MSFNCCFLSLGCCWVFLLGLLQHLVWQWNRQARVPISFNVNGEWVDWFTSRKMPIVMFHSDFCIVRSFFFVFRTTFLFHFCCCWCCCYCYCLVHVSIHFHHDSLTPRWVVRSHNDLSNRRNTTNKQLMLVCSIEVRSKTIWP